MVKSWTAGAVLVAIATLSTRARAAICDDINEYLDIPNPMTGDMEIVLSVTEILCPSISGDDAEIEEIIIDGGTVTIKSDDTVRFVNLGFTVKSGAGLVFDMPKTQLGPNTGGGPDYPGGETVDVEEGGSAIFMGKVVAREITEVNTIFRNAGNMEFQKKVWFKDNNNVFAENSGTLKFRGEATFKDNNYYPIRNQGSGFVRFSKAVVFNHNGHSLDGANGRTVMNDGPDGEILFVGDVTVRDNFSREGSAVYNEGTMKFRGKASFDRNDGNNPGGAVRNSDGIMTFNSAVQFNDNHSDSEGGGVAVDGGEIIFKKGVTFDGNSASNGGAFAVTNIKTYITGGELIISSVGTLTFRKPSAVRFRNNFIDGDDEVDESCTDGFVVDGGTLVGFAEDDVCFVS